MNIEGNIKKFDELIYGSRIKKIYLKDINKDEIIIPQENKVNVIFFFDINNMSQNNILNQLNFIIINLNYENESVKLFGISKGNNKKFKRISSKYNYNFDLINDEQEKAYNHFKLNCNRCIQIYVIDKNDKPRYFASGFDPIFLRDIIQRCQR
jgi:peroxiredoxin